MLLDTSGLLCLFYSSQPLHAKACEAYRHSVKRLTHSYVLAEYVALATARKLSRETTLNLMSLLLEDNTIEITWVNRSLHLEALAFLHQRMDKSYSLCDAVSFVLMRNNKLQEALTTDHHFEQEGFTRLLL
jgi:uncharacterized protein